LPIAHSLCYIRPEAGIAFVDRIEDLDIKIGLLIGGKKTLIRAPDRNSNYRPYSQPPGLKKRAPRYSGGADRLNT
jgi:hypothetical protein